MITITYEKPQDQITGWEYLNDILVRQGNDFKTTVFGKEIHSIAENNKETEAFLHEKRSYFQFWKDRYLC